MLTEERCPDGTKGRGPEGSAISREVSLRTLVQLRGAVHQKKVKAILRRNVFSFRDRYTSARLGNRMTRLCLCELKGVGQSGITYVSDHRESRSSPPP